MTHQELVEEIMEQLNLRSDESRVRVGRAVNTRYKRVTSAIGLASSRRGVAVSGLTDIDSAEVTFIGIDKVDRIIDSRSGTIKLLNEVTFDEMREINPTTGDSPQRWCVQSMRASTVIIRLDAVAATQYELTADGLLTASTLESNDEPQFPEDYHDVLVFGVLADEYRKAEKLELSREMEGTFERRLSDLRMFIAKSSYLTIRQNQVPPVRPYTRYRQ